MKRSLAYLFAGLILFNACGYVLLYAWSESRQERAYEEKLRSGSGLSTLTIRVSEEDIRCGKAWCEGAHEWYVEGRLYDVLEASRDDHSIRLKCYADDLEQKAAEMLRKNISAQSSKSSDPAPDAPQKDVKYHSGTNAVILPNEETVSQPLSLLVVTELCSPFYLVESPPPQDSIAS